MSVDHVNDDLNDRTGDLTNTGGGPLGVGDGVNTSRVTAMRRRRPLETGCHSADCTLPQAGLCVLHHGHRVAVAFPDVME